MSILEVIGGLLIGLVILGGAAWGLSSAFSKSKVASTEQNLVTVRMQTQQMFAGATDYSGLDNALAIKAGLVPKDFIRGSDLKNAWGGNITLEGAANASFTITFTQIPQDECTQLGKFQRDAWLGVSINGNDVATTATVADIVNFCTASNTIVYEAR